MVRRRESRTRLGRPEHSPMSPSRALVTCTGVGENHTLTRTQTGVPSPLHLSPLLCDLTQVSTPPSPPPAPNLTDQDFHRPLGTGSVTQGIPLAPVSAPTPCTDTAHQDGVLGQQNCCSSRYITSALVLASSCPGGCPAVAWPWAMARGGTRVPGVQLLAPLYSHCGNGKRKVQDDESPQANGETQDLCTVQASKA